ncbi:hypothetical protein [Levilactobacillus senmaizukei]|uniref:hypothetical protein n=2 Tax=Levilactobacillus senmaizukei TaxID=431273 RepID=UPI0007842E4A|nr:hypothetical protein [Levilactobacillus senmaizukei]
MTKIRKVVFIIVTICFGLLLLNFSQSMSSTGLSTLQKPFSITSSSGKFTPNKINSHLEDFANQHHINIVKVFSVPRTSTANRQSYYVLGKAHQFSQSQVVKSDLASRSEFLTSDLRYPLYFFGKIEENAIKGELSRLGLKFTRESDKWNWQIRDFLEANYYNVFLQLILLLLFLTLVVLNFKSLRAANIMLLQGLKKSEIFKRAFEVNP